MKKIGYFLLFLVLVMGLSFAEEVTIYLEGVGTQEQVAFFRDSFAIEIPSYGYQLADRSENADYSIRYVITPQGQMFALEASIIRLEDRFTLASNSYFFEYLEDMLPYNQLLIFTLVNNIPRDETIVTITEDDSWRNKWLYLRASLDYPFSFYTLKDNGELIKKDEMAAQLDHKVDAFYPGITLGVEAQVINFFSVELFGQVNLNYVNDAQFFNFALGLELKFPLKFVRHIMLEPYLAGVWTVPKFLNFKGDKFDNVFKSFPNYAAALGFQLSVKRGKSDALFIDISYMYCIDEATVHNPYALLYGDKYANIQYQRSVLRLGIGYKYGFFSRK
jgi:hypothetical protein